MTTDPERSCPQGRTQLSAYPDFPVSAGRLEAGWPTTDVLDVLAKMKDNPELAQPLRHRALRLWNAART